MSLDDNYQMNGLSFYMHIIVQYTCFKLLKYIKVVIKRNNKN